MRRWRNECQQEAVYQVAEKGTADGEEAGFVLLCFVFMTRERAQSSKEKEQNKTSKSLMVTPSQAQGAQGGHRGGARWPGHVREHRGTGVCKDRIKARMKIRRLSMSEGDSKKMSWRTQG